MKYLRLSIFKVFLFVKWSITLPGVQTTICGFLFNHINSSLIFCPPYNNWIFTSLSANDFNSSATCIANSLVGAKTKVWIFFDLGSNLSKTGKPKAAVFHVPVWACPIISFSQFKSKGITPAWIAEGYI